MPSSAKISPSFGLRTESLNAVRLRRVFDLFDGNGDGVITTAEISRALDRLGLGTDPAELSATVVEFIRPDHAGLDFDDFRSLHRQLGDALFGSDSPAPTSSWEEEEEEEEAMREAFNVFDEDGDGFISARELQIVLEKLGLADGRSLDGVREMICSVDADKDGRVDFGEFKHMMRSISIKSS